MPSREAELWPVPGKLQRQELSSWYQLEAVGSSLSS